MSRVFSDRVIMKGDLFVNEDATFLKNLIVKGKQIVDNNLVVKGKLNVTAVSTFKKKLTVNAVTNLKGNVNIDSNLILKGKLKLDGKFITSTATEINYLSGVKSNVQTQINEINAAGFTVNPNDTDNEDYSIIFNESSGIYDSSNFTYNPATRTLTATKFTDGTATLTAGTLNGNVTGNADTATKIATITNDNIVQLTSTQTLTNKTLTSPTISTIINTGTLTLPTSTDTLVGRATSDTLTNKTLTAPTIKPTSSTTLTLPSATDTLVGRATSDTLTNKTLTSPTLTTPVLGTPTSGDLTNCTFPTLNQDTTGNADTASKLNTTSNGIVKTTDSNGTLSIGDLVSGDIPNNAADTSGNADTASKLKTTSNGIVKTTDSNGTLSIGDLVSGDIPNNAADTSGNAATATNVSTTVNGGTNSSYYIPFVGSNADTTQGLETHSSLYYNPSDPTLTLSNGTVSASTVSASTVSATGVGAVQSLTFGHNNGATYEWPIYANNPNVGDVSFLSVIYNGSNNDSASGGYNDPSEYGLGLYKQILVGGDNSIRYYGATSTAGNDVLYGGSEDGTAVYDFYNPSDMRLKDVIGSFDALDKIKNLNLVKYTYNDTCRECMCCYFKDHNIAIDGSTECTNKLHEKIEKSIDSQCVDEKYGVIAQEVKDDFPDVVGYLPIEVPDTEDEHYYAIDYPKFIPHLLKSVQELATLVEELTTENATIKARLETLENN